MLLKYLKRGFYHTFFLGFTSIFSRIVSFLFLPYFLSKLTLAEFGVWDFYQHFFSLGTLLLSSGAATALTRFYILYKDEPLKQNQIIGNACIAVIGLVMLFLVASPGLLFFFNNNNIGAQYFFLSAVLTCLFSFFSLLLAFLRVSEDLKRYAIVFCAQSFIATALTVIGLNYGVGITSFFYAHSCSLILFLPMFFGLTFRHWNYSWFLFKEQLFYSVPLLIYNFIYMGFFTIDRLFLKSAAGYEALGIYALLWRFGALYQFFSIALMNAAPIIIFNAQKEKNGSQLIQKLITYACILILIGGLISIYATRFALHYWFFKDFSIIAEHIPIFFTFLCFLEIARFMQTGFHLTTKTSYIPILSLIILSIQSMLLLFLSSYGVFGICCANTVTFLIYAAISYVIGYAVYPQHIVDYKRLTVVLIAFVWSILALLCTSLHGFFLFLAWVVLLWFAVVTPDEKKWLKKWFQIQKKNPKFVCAYTAIIVHDHRYSNNITNKRISILGPYPPPLGGVSVHIKRVGAKLQNQQNNVTFFDTIKRPRWFVHYLIKLLNFLITAKPNLVYYHTPYSFRGIYEFCFLVVVQRIISFELIVVEHDARYSKELSSIEWYLFAKCIQRVSKVIFIGNTPYISYATTNILPKKFTIESAFLPPDLTQEQDIIKSYPIALFSFINKHYPLILANAFQLRLLQGIDLYGYDMCLELLQRLQTIFPFSGFIFALAKIGDESYYVDMHKRAKELGIADQIFILHGQKELWPLYKCVNVFVRPTSSDNYGISVAEALFFDVPAIASDVCIRPQGTILFTSRDIDEFCEKVMGALNSHEQAQAKRRLL